MHTSTDFLPELLQQPHLEHQVRIRYSPLIFASLLRARRCLACTCCRSSRRSIRCRVRWRSATRCCRTTRASTRPRCPRTFRRCAASCIRWCSFELDAILLIVSCLSRVCSCDSRASFRRCRATSSSCCSAFAASRRAAKIASSRRPSTQLRDYCSSMRREWRSQSRRACVYDRDWRAKLGHDQFANRTIAQKLTARSRVQVDNKPRYHVEPGADTARASSMHESRIGSGHRSCFRRSRR